MDGWTDGRRCGRQGREGTSYGQRDQREKGKGRQQAAGQGERAKQLLSPSEDDSHVKDAGGWKERRKTGETAEEEGGERQSVVEERVKQESR